MVIINMSKPLKITYKQVENFCLEIYKKLSKTKFKPDSVIGVSVGGVFPAIHFARLFNTKNLLTIAVKSYDGKKRKEIQIVNLPKKESLEGKKVLLIDDISDSGSTLKFIVNLLKKEYKVKDIKTITIFVNEDHCKYYPDFYSKKVKKWLDFPWDRFEEK
jgi:uncharacterized protein